MFQSLKNSNLKIKTF